MHQADQRWNFNQGPDHRCKSNRRVNAEDGNGNNELDEGEDLNKFPAFLDPLEQGINDLLESMKRGSYQFGREDLPFMDIVHRFGDEIPFSTLLKQINETHRRGIEAEPEG